MWDLLTRSWRQRGAAISPETFRPLHFGDPGAELRAAFTACALADGSDLGRLLATGPDYLDLLHRVSTGDVVSLEPHEGRPTILTTARGRIVERLFVHVRPDGAVLSIGGRDSGDRVLEHLARYTFAEKIGLRDVTDTTFQFLLVGPLAPHVLDAVGLERPEPFRLRSATLGGTALDVLGDDGLSADGFSIVGPRDAAAEVWETLLRRVESSGGRPTGDETLEARRVLRGLVAAGHELTLDHNPLEAGQWDAVSFDKGCYVGQEVVARLQSREKVSRAVVGLELSAGATVPRLGAHLYDGDRAVGDLTSAVLPPEREAPIALGYVKCNALRPGLELRVGEGEDAPSARVVDLPFRR